jgi:hypothetical protein
MHLAKERATSWDIAKNGNESAVSTKGGETICPTKVVLLPIERITLKNVIRKLTNQSSFGAIVRWKCGLVVEPLNF